MIKRISLHLAQEPSFENLSGSADSRAFFHPTILSPKYYRTRAAVFFFKAFTIAGRNPKFLAPALYGLGLVEVSETDVIGLDDTTSFAKHIGSMLSRLGIDRQRLSEVSLVELEKAQRFFQHDLDGYPNLARFKIVEGLRACSPQQA